MNATLYDVPTEKREAWFERKLQEKVQVTISHPRIIETGLDLLSHPTLIFYESGYSLHTLRQVSRKKVAGFADDGGEVLCRRTSGARRW